MRNVYEFVLKDEAMEALEREAGNRGKAPGELAEEIVRDWLVSRGNLRIF